MIDRDETELRVDLEYQLVDARGQRHFTATADGRLLGQVVAATDQGWLRVAVDDNGATLGMAEQQGLLGAVTALARAERFPGVVLSAGSHLLLRQAARSDGFAGPLRGDLARDLLGARATETASGVSEDRFVADLNSLLPGMTVVPANRPGGRLRSVFRSASTGVSGTVHLTVLDGSSAKPLSLAVPLGDDVMAECVALGIETAVAVRRRFRPLVDRVRMFYDQSVQGLRTGTVAGLAEASARDVHLNPAFAQAGEMETLDRQLRERRAQSQSGQPQRRPPLTVLPPFTRIDSVVAHEFWHQIEFGFESSRYHDSVEFRRALGGYFGVETLEHVIRGAAGDAPAAWQVARGRLAAEVSAYATTAPKEATAELFTQWWCTVADPPPVAQFFAEILGRFFPAADLVR